MTPTELTVGVLLGALGLGYFVYGRRQRRAMPFLSGLGLFVIPYAIDPVPGQLVAGAVLLTLPAFFKF